MKQQVEKGANSTTCDPWTSRDFVEEMRNHSVQCQHCLSGNSNTHNRITLTKFFKPSILQIATTSPTCQESPQLSSGPRHSLLVLTTFDQILAQFMRLSKPEPEPLLQPDLHLLGNVATKRLGDLWQPHHHLHQRENRASETKVSRVHGR